jgi:hypothetical protein
MHVLAASPLIVEWFVIAGFSLHGIIILGASTDHWQKIKAHMSVMCSISIYIYIIIGNSFELSYNEHCSRLDMAR